MRIVALIATALLVGACGQSADQPAGDPSPGAASAPDVAIRAPLPAGSHAVSGRTATVSLPFRTADNLAWVTASPASEIGPFTFKGLDIQPGAGPDGSDLAIFTYEASGPGAATLAFGLVPTGQMLVGPPDRVFTGSVARRYEAKVRAE